MKNIKYTLLIGSLLFLGSCQLSDIEPSFNKTSTTGGDEKLDNIQNSSKIYIDDKLDYKENIAVKEEINDRVNGYTEINDNKEYLLKISTHLEEKIISFKAYIEITRQLILVDLKIVNAIQQGFLDEKSINKNNYFYTLLRTKEKGDRVLILKNMDDLIMLVDNKKAFDEFYYTNFDLGQVDKLNKNTATIYEYTNYYLKNVKYNLDIQTNINIILKSFNVLKIDKIKVSEQAGGFLKEKTQNYFYESTLKNLQKNILE